MGTRISERGLVLAPMGRDATIAVQMLTEAGLVAEVCPDRATMLTKLVAGAGFAVIAEEAFANQDPRPLSQWLADQAEWSDFPFVLLTRQGGGLERNPDANRYLKLLGNVTFIERPFHPTTLISLAEAALRGRRRQYEARERLTQLQDSERQYRTLADSIPIFCWSANSDGAIYWYNRRWYEYTGTTPDDMIGWGWTSVHDPDVLPLVLERWRDAIAVGERFEMVFPLRGADGIFRPFLTRVEPVRDESGIVINWFGTNTDISAQRAAEEALRNIANELEERVEQRTREREQAQEALRQSQKMEAIGQLTGGVAHDFNNLLTVIRGSVDLLNRPGLDEEKRARYIDAIGSTADRAAKLTGQLLAFARRQALTPERFDVVQSLREVVGMLDMLSGSRVEVRVETADYPIYTLADRGQFDTAIVNMAVNARDAMNGEGTLKITAVEVDGIPAQRGHPAISGRYLAISLTDSGSGIADADINRIFEPFFTTKAVGAGTGLGLSQVFGFTKQSGGDVRVSSTPNEGSTFTLYLPRVDFVEDVKAAPLARERIDGAGTNVLLVEDNQAVGEFATQALSELGYQSMLVASAAEALTELERGADRFDIVFSDVVMPGMNGVELGSEIRRRYTDMPVLLASGYSDVLAQESDHGFHLLHKPYSLDQLATAIRTLTSAEAPRGI